MSKYYQNEASKYIDWKRIHGIGTVPRLTAEELGGINGFARWLDERTEEEKQECSMLVVTEKNRNNPPPLTIRTA